MENYEKVRIVGKGAFGIAVLYKKISSGSLVVLKEINTADMSSGEFDRALNEVEILSSLHHPNIIGYGGCFTFDGRLMIEMEYADGGTLSQFLSKRTEHLPEVDIVSMFEQITDGISYMHDCNVLHRDLKSANVFLNVDGCVKIGDFGIAKILSTNVSAETFLGTPYYISPEMCEGKTYDEKSDIWAMGCILYEVCCLRRAFQASSLPALVNQIMLGNYKPLPKKYSTKLHRLVSALLEKNPADRPTAKDVHNVWMADIKLSLYNDGNSDNIRSVLYEYKFIENEINIQPIRLPPKIKIINVSVGKNHYLAVNEDGNVFTWGKGNKGQLGLGRVINYVSNPRCLNLNKLIKMSCAGKNFSLLLTRDDTLLSFGDGFSGSLGHGDWKSHSTPKTIDALIQENIHSISCSFNHVAALTGKGEIYTWGCGSKGQTGQNIFNNSNKPTKINFDKTITPVLLVLGFESTIVKTSKGKLYACGWNNFNKLSLKNKNLFGLKNTVQFYNVLKKMKYLCGSVESCCLGNTHSIVIAKTLCGTQDVYLLGRINMEHSNSETHYPIKLTNLNNVSIKIIKCSSTYNLIGTRDNAIMIWGKKYCITNKCILDQHYSDEIMSQSECTLWKSSLDTSILSQSHITAFLEEVIEYPKVLISLYASTSQRNKKCFLTLTEVYPLQNGIMILINCGVPLRYNSENIYKIKKLPGSQNLQNTINNTNTNQLPKWIKEDIAISEFTWYK